MTRRYRSASGRPAITRKDIADCMRAAAQGYVADGDEEKAKMWRKMARRFEKKDGARIPSSERQLRRSL